MKIAFTGHRPDKLGGYGPSATQERVRSAIRKALSERRDEIEAVISGMALGVDQWAAEESLALNIPLIAAVPFAGQESVWPEQSQLRFRDLLSKASRVEIVCEGGYARWKMQRRNEWMVDHCDLLVAVWDGTTGGTANCVKYASKVGRDVLRINPVT